MSEQPFGTDEAPAAAAAASPPAADAPHQFTPEELAAARAQLEAQGELDPAQRRDDIAEDQADLGMRIADKATADAVDPAELLRSIKSLQAQVDRLNSEKAAANVPDLVKYTTAIADHLQARADQHPAIHADPDHTYMPALETAAALVNDAQAAAESGDVAKVLDGIGALRRFLDRHGRHHPQQDNSYLHDLAGEAEEAAHKAAA